MRRSKSIKICHFHASLDSRKHNFAVEKYPNLCTLVAAYTEEYTIWRSKSIKISALSWQPRLRNTQFGGRKVSTFLHSPGSLDSGIHNAQVEKYQNLSLSCQSRLTNAQFRGRKVSKFVHSPRSLHSGIYNFDVDKYQNFCTLLVA